MIWIWYLAGIITPFALVVIIYNIFSLYLRIKWLFRDFMISPLKDERGWLLENGEVTPKYIGVIDGALRWTGDSLKALRLARREDGDALAEIVDDCWHIREHMWCGPKELTAAQPQPAPRPPVCPKCGSEKLSDAIQVGEEYFVHCEGKCHTAFDVSSLNPTAFAQFLTAIPGQKEEKEAKKC